MLIILDDFSVHAVDAASPQAKDLASSIEAPGLSQFISTPTYQAGHMLFGIEINCDLVYADAVSQSDHFSLKVWLSVPCSPCLGKLIVFLNHRAK